MMQQYLAIKALHENDILMFRMGDFYEMFFEDAVTAAPILDIALTTRDRKSKSPVAMCGVPVHSVDSYIAKLVEQGFRVAICDQVEDAKQTKGLVKREVIRIETPGTILADDESFRARYIACLYGKAPWSVAFADLSTGDFSVTSLASLSEVVSELYSNGVRELLLSEEDQAFIGVEDLQHKLNDISVRSEHISIFAGSEDSLKEHFEVRSLSGLGLTENKNERIAAGALLTYLKLTQKNDVAHIRDIKRLSKQDYMLVDPNSQRTLGLLPSNQVGKKTAFLQY